MPGGTRCTVWDLGGIIWVPGGAWGTVWALFGRHGAPWGASGAVWALLGHCGHYLGTIWAPWGTVGTVWALFWHHGALWALSGHYLGAMGPPLDVPWRLGHAWGCRGTTSTSANNQMKAPIRKIKVPKEVSSTYKTGRALLNSNKVPYSQFKPMNQDRESTNEQWQSALFTVQTPESIQGERQCTVTMRPIHNSTPLSQNRTTSETQHDLSSTPVQVHILPTQTCVLWSIYFHDNH